MEWCGADEECQDAKWNRTCFSADRTICRPFTIVDEGTNYKECFYGYLPLAHQVANDKIYIISYRPWVAIISDKPNVAVAGFFQDYLKR